VRKHLLIMFFSQKELTVYKSVCYIFFVSNFVSLSHFPSKTGDKGDSHQTEKSGNLVYKESHVHIYEYNPFPTTKVNYLFN